MSSNRAGTVGVGELPFIVSGSTLIVRSSLGEMCKRRVPADMVCLRENPMLGTHLYVRMTV